jgi:hypothetical protein
MKIFREWARINLALRLWRKPTDEEFHAELDLWCRKQFSSAMEVDSLSDFLRACFENGDFILRRGA